MDLTVTHSRGSAAAASGSSEFSQVLDVLTSIDRASLVARQEEIAASGSRPKGGQRALNKEIAVRLERLGWLSNARVFRARSELPSWRLSFINSSVGVVVCTQNVGYLAQKLLTIQVAAGAAFSDRWEPSAVDLGVLLVPGRSLKDWSRMDGTVATSADAVAQNGALATLLTAPIVIVGMESSTEGQSWPYASVFPGGG